MKNVECRIDNDFIIVGETCGGASLFCFKFATEKNQTTDKIY